MKLQAPKFLDNLYRDMRDRRLLLPALALVVALIATPVLLRKPAESAAPLPAAVPVNADSEAITSAVLVDDSVPVREYEKRLAKLKAKNPFEANIKVESSGGDGASSDTAAGGDTGTTPAPTGTSTDTSTSAGTGGPTSTDISTGDTTTTDDTTTEPVEPAEPEIRFFAGRVDITMGPLGKAREYDNVKYLTFLPDDARPIATFVGLTGSGRSEQAVFAISSLVEVGEGDGTCAPHKPDPCQFLTLKPGESRNLKFDGKTFRLKVRDTRIVRIKDPREQNSEGDDSATDSTTDGGDDSPGGQQP